ncbi:MAG: phosphatidylserine decarboxylase, partial [Myxococcaceae bacterium]
MQDGTFLALMRLVPKSALSRAVGTLTRLPAPAPVHRAAMRAFVRAYGVDMSEAERDLGGYGRFSDFFSRGLRPGARPVDPDPRAVVSPVDGVVSQAGILEEGACLQAKGIQFPVDR